MSDALAPLISWARPSLIEGYLVPNREQKGYAQAQPATNPHCDLPARMPLICVKSRRIQRHDGIHDESEQLDRRTQFETGLTGTPYATNRRKNLNKTGILQ